MNLIGLYIIVPLSVAALLTGLIQSLGTQWRLFRHWLVLIKFLLTIGATGLLMLHQFAAVERAARLVVKRRASSGRTARVGITTADVAISWRGGCSLGCGLV